MSPRVRTHLVWVTVALALPVPLAAQSQASLRVGPADGQVRIDGRLDEAVWMAADSLSNLTMLEPTQGGPTTGRTVVRVLATSADLYIGIVAYDPDPTGIVSFSKARDSELGREDHVVLVLDTFLDGRSGYVFAVNPDGARYDALVANAGEGRNANWDAAWDAGTARGPWGWSAELRIPVASLSFGRGLGAWGFNVERRIERRQERARWASPARDIEVTQTSRAGRLEGLPVLDTGIGLTAWPSVVGGAGVPSPGASLDRDVEPSLDLAQRLGSNVTASLTVNTDFAETEVDTRQTNLTRFPLFFPEKRAFFLEGSDIFDFGLGSDRDLVPFHSRRIGLLSGTEVPLDAGAKVSGRIGDTNVGGLVVSGGEFEGVTPGSTMGVARVRQNMLGESSVGAMSSFGDPTGRPGSWLGGADLSYATSRFRGDKNFLVGVWALTTDREDLSGDAWDRGAAGIKVDYPNDLWDVVFAFKRIGASFDPSLGFVPRKGVRAYTARATYLPRPGWSWLRWMRNELFVDLVTDLDAVWESYRVFTAPLNWLLESGDRIELNWVPEGERLRTPFEIADTVVIAPGAYEWMRYRVEVATASRRPVNGQVSVWWGPFYRGHLSQISGRVQWRLTPSVITEVSGGRDTGLLPEGDFTKDLGRLRLLLNLSSDLQVSTFVQYDNESETVGTNTRLRWTFNPLGDLFVVYNHNVQDDGVGWVRESNQLLVKVRWGVRF